MISHFKLFKVISSYVIFRYVRLLFVTFGYGRFFHFMLLLVTLRVATLALGSQPRQGLAKIRLRVKPENHISCFWSVGGCEGMNPHTLKWAPILGVGIPMDFQIFRKQL
jgi:hypothetical protein